MLTRSYKQEKMAVQHTHSRYCSVHLCPHNFTLPPHQTPPHDNTHPVRHQTL